jgi:hypothetical protein
MVLLTAASCGFERVWKSGITERVFDETMEKITFSNISRENQVEENISRFTKKTELCEMAAL